MSHHAAFPVPFGPRLKCWDGRVSSYDRDVGGGSKFVRKCRRSVGVALPLVQLQLQLQPYSTGIFH